MAEPSSNNNATLVSVLVVAGVFGGILALLLCVACCCGAAAGAAKTDCGKPPDKARDPIAYARWQRECEQRRRQGEGVQLLRSTV